MLLLITCTLPDKRIPDSSLQSKFIDACTKQPESTVCTFEICVMLIHRYFRTEETGDSMLIIPVGNVTADTELTYEYGVRTKKNPSIPGKDKGKS